MNDMFGIDRYCRPFGTYYRPVGALLVMAVALQGLTPLANNWRPFGT
jgi:hypothetical protein